MKISLLLLLSWPVLASAQMSRPVIAEISEEIASETLFLNPHYLVYPLDQDSDGKIPLVIYLHGAGGVGTEIMKIAGQSRGLVEAIERFEKTPCLVVAPQCLHESVRSEERGTWEPGDLDLFLKAVLAAHPNIDRDRIYLTGNSMGGYGCWVWGGNSPRHFAAIAPVVGGIGRGGPKDVSPDIEAWAANLVNVPLWAFAGRLDKVVPAERSERMVAAIRKAGGELAKIEVFPAGGHNVGREVYHHREFFDWLFSRRREMKSASD